MKAAFLGRLESDNGVELILAFFSNQKKWKIDVYGSGPLEKYLNRKYKNSKVINFLGEQSDVFKRNRYQLACVSSYLSMLEAMIAKVPILSVAEFPLKLDYLSTHPCSTHIRIVKNMGDLLNLNLKSNINDVEYCYRWAKSQTWKKLYSEYKKLWGI